jgi:hypothetical protein
MDLTGKTVTVATAAGSTNTTAAASTAFVQQELTTLIGGAPSTLNDLNELAAAINDDANYNSTLTTALATKLPLAGGTLTGALTINSGTANTGLTITSTDAASWLTMTDPTASLFFGNTGGEFALWTGGSEAMRVDGSGKVGIGGATPQGNLTIKGAASDDIDLLTFSEDGTNQSFSFNGNFAGSGSTGNNLTLDSYWTNDIMSWAGDGNVGIGTASPNTQLQINNATDPKIRLESNESGSKRLDLWIDGGTAIGYIAADQSASQLAFKTAGTERMRITAAGNVGIGVSSPSSALDIRGSGNVDIMSKIINTGQTSDGRKTEFLFGKDNGANLSGVLKYVYDTTQADRRIDLVHYGTSNGISILDGGNVGIGETSPDGRLHIKGVTATGDASHILFENTQGSKVFAIGGGSTGITNSNLYFRNVTDNTRPMVITDAGKVGIGYDTPASLLDVRGSLAANGTAATPTAYFINNQSGATSGSIYIGASTGIDWKIGKNVTGILNNANFSIADSSGNRRFDIDASGNVGIGTTSPLSLDGNAAPGLTVSSNGPYILLQDANNSDKVRYISNNTGQFQFGIVGDNGISGKTEHMRIDTSGKILIGDSASHTSDLLQIETPASGGGHGIQIRRNDSNTDQGVGRIQFGNNTATDLASISAKTDGATDNAALLFNTSVSGGANTERMRIDAGGRVGVNQTPLGNNFAFQVTGLGGASGDARAVYLKGAGAHTSIGGTGPTLTLQNTNSTANNIVKLSFESASSGETVSINAINTNHSSHYGDMAFNTRGSGGYSEKMRIMANGNVGIGTSSPSTNYTKQVHIHSTGTGSSLHLTDNVSGAGNGDGFELITHNGSAYVWQRESNNLMFGTAATERMRIDSVGSVGIGNTPSTWASSVYDALQIGGGIGVGAIAGRRDGINQVNFGLNWHYASGATLSYVGSSFATNYAQEAGTHRWFHASSGTAAAALTFTESMRIDASGRVGIGTDNPKRPLQIGTTSQFPISFNGNYPDIHFNTYYESGWRIHTAGFGAKTTFNGATGAWVFSNVASAQSAAANFTPVDRFAILANGNVGIGISTPSAKLQVEGTFAVRSSSSSIFNDTNNAENVRMLVSGSHFNADEIDKDFQVSSDTNSHALFVQGSDAKVGIGGAPVLGGTLTVNDTTTLNGGIRTRTHSASIYENVATIHTGAGSATDWHIKTNFFSTNNIMFVARVHGYAYGNSGHIVDISRSGYAYAAHGQLTGSQVKNNGSSTDTLEVYFSSDNYVCFRHHMPSTGYYSGLSFDIKMLSPTGYNFNFQVQSHVINSTTGNHY